MKSSRQEKIISLITGQVVETQEELAGLLQAAGYCVTQATVSRDIRELKLTKITTEDGRQRYAMLGQTKKQPAWEQRHARLLKDAVVSLDTALNLLVVKTNAGMAMAVAAAIDALELEDMVGTLAGDDTVFCAIRSLEATDRIKNKLLEIIR